MAIIDIYKSLFGRKGMADGNPIDMSEHGRVGGVSTGQAFKHVMSPGTVDSNNSTTSTLLAGAEWTGTATDILNYSGITVLVDADVTGTLNAQFSQDGSDWHSGESYTIPALSEGDAKFFTPPVQARYFRLHYVNDGTNQTRFHVHTTLKPNPVKWSSHNLNSNLRDDDDAELVASVLKLRTAQDQYVSGSATNSGNFKVSLEEYNGSVATNGLPTKEKRSTTPTTTSVADTASSTTILASNANRLGATIANDSSAVLYLLLGSGTASATNYTVRMAQYGYYEVPFNYTGQINGIWASDPGDGAARVTEIE